VSGRSTSPIPWATQDSSNVTSGRQRAEHRFSRRPGREKTKVAATGLAVHSNVKGE